MGDEVALHADTIRTVVGYLRSGISVNVVGMRTSGRSAVLRRVVDLLADDGISAVTINGIPALHDRPLAALGVGGVEVPNAPSGPGSLSAAVTALERRISARPSVLVIDDVESVDQVSAGVVSAVRRRVPVPVLASSRPDGRIQNQTVFVTGEMAPSARVVLPPLRYDAVHALVHELLPGTVEPSALARIATKSGGLPGLVAALVDTGRRSGRLVRRDGLWVVRDGLWDPSMAQAVEPLLAGLEEQHLDALALLSLAGSLDLEVARSAIPWQVLTQLDDAGLLQVLEDGGQPVIGVFPPLVAEFLRNESSPIRRSRAVGELSRLLGDRGTWRAVPPTAPRAVAQGAPAMIGRRFDEQWQVEAETRRTAWTDQPTPAHAVPLLIALLGVQADAEEVDAVVRGTNPAPDDPRSEALLVVWHAVDLGLRRGDLEAADRLVAEAMPRFPEYAGLLSATRAHLCLITSRIPDDALLHPDQVGEDPVNREALRATRAECLVAAGRIAEARAELEGFDPLEPRFRLSARLSATLLLVFDGHPEEGVSQALSYAQEARAALDPGAYQAYAYVAGLGLMMAGRLDECDTLLSSVLALPNNQTLQTHFRNGVLTLAAVVASFRGRASYAESLAEQAEALGAPRGPYPAMAPDMATSLVRGPGAETSDALWDLVDERLDAGMVVSAMTIAVAALERRPEPARAAELAERVKDVGSALVQTLAEYCVAVGLDDVDALATSAGHLHEAGYELYATRAGVTRALALRTRGDIESGSRQAERSWAEAAVYAGDLRGLFAPLARSVDLTSREREIAVMVSEGMHTAEIAASLVLSVRTVENHLLNAFRKAGVDNRDALARAVDTWASTGTL
ncbi:helix-turn-helix transcriptional regulator [Cellulomonas denverensis]|uniref:Helix-turn-helix transcriptional regulator n=1 Tax=Cellulomonas denverensis TaxID=264297 RepID=A0A7X6KWR0_9CELL|nr:helix-turn-helix transcriptional regulator [Cellulomonas denverensis]NKY23428.1 helix-turn-helix transcriptional regulator [Cellulomonas denverensis]GIG25090.1 putative regulatory protein, LuxR [Cellulomonas denverensis]